MIEIMKEMNDFKEIKIFPQPNTQSLEKMELKNCKKMR